MSLTRKDFERLMRAKKYNSKQYYRKPRVTYRSNKVYLRAPKKSKVTLFDAKPTVEYKNLDSQIVDGATPVGTGMSGLGVFNLIAQGPGNQQRIGRKAVMRSMYYRLNMANVAGSSGQVNAVRVVVVFDRAFNGTLPALADVFSPTTDFNAMMNLNNADRFLVVSDEVYQSSAGGVSAGLGEPTFGKCYKKMALETIFKGTGATAADIATGALIGYIAQNATGGATFNFNVRTRYTDS